ncbi:hypothetical protein JG688_00015017 [Phytophthora aleatoria]|uniref:Uncharacterized protein n=1 Tax=Phytophthora aleatoria TaxID=2496075 RepID=A0A8J5IZZ5_9STRA|nr:hypothetical protein JG688_00015017 [Phytophthora aleatoria]
MRYFVQREKDHEMRNLVRKLTPALTGGVLIYKDSNINMVMVEGGKKAMKHFCTPQASVRPKLLHATVTAVMELIDNLRNAVLQQREQEVTNFFTNVNELREFISAREPAAGVNITAKMCCYNCKRLSADTGSRITLPFIAQVTVWDSKKKVGSPKTGRMNFRVGAVYEFKQVHSVGYFSDIAKGSVQLEDVASDRVVERLAPVLKRKAGLEPSGRHPKARALLQHDESEEQKEGGGAETAGITGVSRKRGAAVSRG